MFTSIFKNKKGQSLAEVVIAMSIFSIITLVVSTIFLDSLVSLGVSNEEVRATVIAQEGLEAARSIRDESWLNLIDGAHGVANTGGSWAFSGVNDIVDIYTRVVTISSVERDVNNNIVATGGQIDPRTKKVTSVVSWTARNALRSVQAVTYLTDWNVFDWHETSSTDFSAGTATDIVINGTGDSASLTISGDTSFAVDRWIPGGGLSVIHTTDLDFDPGTFTDTVRARTGATASIELNNTPQWGVFSPPAANSDLLNDIHMSSADLGYAVGNTGSILKWDGANWFQVASGVTADLNGVYVKSVNDVWLVGDSGLILHWNGLSWSTIPSASNKNLNAIDFSSPTDGWIVATGGEIQHWNGAVWTAVTSGTNSDLYDVSVISETNAWAVDRNGHTYNWNGSMDFGIKSN